MNRRTALAALASTILTPALARAQDSAGQSAPLAERLPKVPRRIDVAAMGRAPGKAGGEIRTIIGGQKDIRLMTVCGYSRLVGYDTKLQLQPDILESYEAADEKVFTFRIRDGHKWSDGSPLTSEDFRYCWEDVWLNDDLSPGGIPPALRVGGNPPRFEVLDPLTVRYSWDGPNPDFLPSIAGPQPLSMVMPAAYLKQFHEKYQSEDKLAELMKKYKAKKWNSLHIKMSRQYRPENPDLPSLDPWHNTTAPPAEQFVFERNPYFHRVDENGVQLPYVDRVILNISSSTIIAAKTGAGESDLQFFGIDFGDYAFMKDAEKRYPINVHLWKKTQGSRLALLPNLNCGDMVWRPLLRDARVRRALSLAIDREEINKAVFFGLGHQSADTVLPGSPLYRPELAAAWSAHDPDQANRLLDEAGLATRGDDGYRLLPDGRTARIVVETAGESTLETDVLELVIDHWTKVGVALFIRTSQRDVFRSRAMGGEIMMSMWSGLDNGVPTPDMNPGQLAPTADDQLQWPVWGAHYLSDGKLGEPPDVPEAAELVSLVRQWRRSADRAERETIWRTMLGIYTDQVFSIGFVNETHQPVLAARRLRNVPDDGLFGFDPTSYLGVYSPDTFWLDEEA